MYGCSPFVSSTDDLFYLCSYPLSFSRLVFSRTNGAKKWFHSQNLRRKRSYEKRSDKADVLLCWTEGTDGRLPQSLNSGRAHLQTPSAGNFLLHLQLLVPPLRCNPGPAGGPCADDKFCRPITFTPLNVISSIQPPLLPPRPPPSA